MSILNLTGGSGGSYIRFMPSANAWVFDKAEIALDVLVIDHESVRTGWGKMAEGAAPEWQWDERLGVAGPRPSDEHKRGFSVKLYTKATGTVEWSSTGTGPVMGFETIFEQVWNAKADNAGKVAVVRYTGSQPLKVGKGSTRKPEFALVKWVSRASVPWDGGSNGETATPPPPPPKAAPALVEDEIAF